MRAKKSSCKKKLVGNIPSINMTKKKKSGAGFKKVFKNIVAQTKKHLNNIKPKCKKAAIELAIAAAKEFASALPVEVPRVIPVPKTGGVLPLIPIFAGLSAAGSLSGGAVGILKAVKALKLAKQKFKQLKTSDDKIEQFCIGKGLHVKPHRKGLGIFMENKKN